MRIWAKAFFLIFRIGCAAFFGGSVASAEERIALKSGESTELRPVFWLVNCKSIMVGTPEIEVLEGPAELTLTIREGLVLPRWGNCANKVPGGTIVATAKDVKAPIQARLTFRVKYKTKVGDRQHAFVYDVSLFP